MSVLLIHSHFGSLAGAYAEAAAEGRLRVVRECDLGTADFEGASGLLTTTHLDQIGFLNHVAVVSALLARGGRWFFNGHMLRRLLPGLDLYVPLERPKRADLTLTRLNEHPIFAGIEQKRLEENNGVAGFYGRGHNPLPAGGVAVNGIGPDRLPIDWEWAPPGGGRIFSHAGNDIGGPDDADGSRGTAGVPLRRIIAWCAGETGR